MVETAIYLVPKGGFVLPEKDKSVYDVTGNDKENITTLFTVNATGEFVPSLTSYKYERLPQICLQTDLRDWE